MYIDKYLYEIIDDYKKSESDEEKNDILQDLYSSIWSCQNKRRVFTRTLHFKVKPELLKTEIGEIFNVWSDVEYKSYRSMTKETEWCYLIRQKINNIYTRYCDKDVILKKDYMNKLNTPKKLYYQWIAGVEMNADELTTAIDDAISDADILKKEYQKQKISLSWNKYKVLIEDFLHKTMDNCKLIEDCENKTVAMSMYDFMNEDNLYIKYFCKCLEGEMRKYQKRYYKLPQNTRNSYKRCSVCGNLFEKKAHNQHRCKDCQTTFNRKNKTEKQRKYRVEKLKN